MAEWWWHHATCAGIGSDLFFVDKGDSTHDAKRACGMCPVREQCLADALCDDVEYGIFGGLSPMARRPLRALVARGHDPSDIARRAMGSHLERTAA